MLKYASARKSKIQQLTKKCNEKGKEGNTRLTIVLSAWIHKSQDKRSNLHNKLSCVKQLSQNDNARGLTYDIEALPIRNKD